MEHKVTVEPEGRRYVAVCTCHRWRSESYAEKDRALTKGIAHELNGDQMNRAHAQFHRGPNGLGVELRWYRRQAEDPLNTPEDRAQWARLADEMARRVEGPPSEQETLW